MSLYKVCFFNVCIGCPFQMILCIFYNTIVPIKNVVDPELIRNINKIDNIMYDDLIGLKTILLNIDLCIIWNTNQT